MADMEMKIEGITEVLGMELEEGGGYTPGLPCYDGSYDITPKVTGQTMETKNKTMRDDVIIRGIPFEAVSNGAGTTITIGGY